MGKTYKYAQFIAYEIYTGPANPGMPDAYYKGILPDEADLKIRAAYMKDAIRQARASYTKLSDPDASDTLKIFMAPEFYFRGANGAYDISLMSGDGLGTQYCLINDLCDFVSNPDYKDWLFVFGTAVFRSLNVSENTYEAYNVSLVQMGGMTTREEQESHRVVCMKEFKSGIDFLKIGPGGFTDSSVQYLPACPARSYTKEINTPGAAAGGGYNGGCIFNLMDITFGLEVCLDHARGRLRRVPPDKGQIFVQIQLIPSAGMSILMPSVATCAGGVVFNVDGYSGGAFYGYHAGACTVARGFPTNLADIAAIAPVPSISAFTNNSEAQSSLGNDFNSIFFIPSNAGVQLTPKQVFFQRQNIPPVVGAP